MQQPFSVGLVQVGCAPCDVEGNRKLLEERAREAFQDGAKIVILPEMAATGYTTDVNDLRAAAEAVDGPTTNSWRAIAAEHNGYIAGGFCEEHDDDLFNTAVVVGAEGVVLHYRKLHLFADEKNAFTAGDLGLPIARLEVGVIGLCVCYDLRFVEVARALALKGVELLCVPTAWLAGFDSAPNDSEMCSQAQGAVLQANLNQIYIACASQVGRHGTHEFLGSSVLADPYGEVISGPLSSVDDEVSIGQVEPTAVDAARERGPLITPRADRRTDVYGVAIDGTVL